MAETSKIGSQANSGSSEEKIRSCTGTDRETAVSVTDCSTTMLHTHKHTHTVLLCLSFSLSTSFTTLNFVWENSCAAAAILNYIGQWEIVFECLLLFYN